jgi:NAD(P)-dependent dehydrogenase (short-subunit alcohol dehydrogenase family)
MPRVSCFFFCTFVCTFFWPECAQALRRACGSCARCLRGWVFTPHVPTHICRWSGTSSIAVGVCCSQGWCHQSDKVHGSRTGTTRVREYPPPPHTHTHTSRFSTPEAELGGFFVSDICAMTYVTYAVSNANSRMCTHAHTHIRSVIRFRITTNVVCPGSVLTEGTKELFYGSKEERGVA